jgi:hypothetical protein
MYGSLRALGCAIEHGPITFIFERSIKMKLKELKEILEQFDGEQEIMYSEDGFRFEGIHLVGSVRKIEKDTDGKLKESRFAYIS